MKNVLFILFSIFSIVNFAQFKEIDPPSFSEVEKHFLKSKKTVESLAYNDGFKDIKDWKYSYPSKAGSPGRSKPNGNCASDIYYVRQYYTYPNDLLTYTFYTKSPEVNGQTIHYRIRVTYSRSSYGNCESGILNKYEFVSSIARRSHIEGVTAEDKAFVDVLSSQANKNNLLIFDEYITAEGWNYKGFTRIDSIVVKKTNSGGGRYRTGAHDVYKDCWVYGEIANYDDFICKSAIKGYAIYKIGVDAYNNNNTFIYSSLVGKPQVIDSLNAEAYPSYQVVGDVRDYGTTFEAIQKGSVLSPELVISRSVIKKTHNYIRQECLANSWQEVSKNKKMLELFKDQEDLLEVWKGYNEIKNGLWEVSNIENFYEVNLDRHSTKRNSGNSSAIYRINRELTKDQRKQIKGKVGKTSYSESKYKQSGPLEINFSYIVEEGKLKIEYANAKEMGLLKLTID